MANIAIAYVDNTNVLTLTELKSDDEDVFLNDAVVTVTVKDSGGNAISGETWPVTMDYVAASNGNYRAPISSAADLTSGQQYTAVVDADASTTDAERIAHWEFPFKAAVRKS